MRRSIFALSAVLALPLAAQQAQPSSSSGVIDKFAVISIGDVVHMSGHCRKAIASVELLNRQWDEKIQAKAQEIQAKQQQLQASGLSEEGRETLQKQIRDLNIDGQKMQEDQKAEVERANQKFNEQVLNQEVLPIVRQLAAEKGVSTVLAYQPGLFAVGDDKAIHAFSDEVAKRLDAKFPADAGFQGGAAPAAPAAKPAAKPAIRK